MGWKHFDLFDAGAPKAATIPCGYPFEAFGTQHVVYVGEDGHVWEALWEEGAWSPYDLTGFTGAPVQSISSPLHRPTAYVFRRTQHVIFVNSPASEGDTRAGDICELWWDDGSGWHLHNLTGDVGAPLAVQQAPCAYAFEAHGTQHVDYLGSDGHIHELWWDNDGWHHNDLTKASGGGAPLATSSPQGYVFANTLHVLYVDEDGYAHQMIWDRGWTHSPVTTPPFNVPVAPETSLAAYVFEALASQHVNYIGVDGRLYEVSWDSGGSHYDDLIDESGVDGEAPAVLCAYAFESQRTRHVDYTGSTGEVIELWRDSDGWHNNNLTNAAGRAPPADQGNPAGYAFATDGTQHVFYIGIEDNHIHELRWTAGLAAVLPIARR